MRICFFGLDLTCKGGIAKLSVELIKHLAQNRDVDEVLVVCDNVREEAFKTLKHRRIEIQRLGHIRKSDLARIVHRNIRLAHLSDELKRFDVFHVLDNRALPLVNSNLHPLVVTIHDVMTNEFLAGLRNIGLAETRRLAHMIDHYPPQWFLELISVAKAQGIIVSSPIIAGKLEKLYGDIVRGKARIIPPGFDPKRFNPNLISKSDARKFFNLDSSSKILLHVGGDTFGAGRKGLPYLLSALDYISKTSNPNRRKIVLIVIGKVPKKWKHLSSSFEDHIVELLYVPEDILPILYRATDLLVMPSVSEGWGMALIEALACATPVIASAKVPSAYATKSTSAVHIEPNVSNAKDFAECILRKLETNCFGNSFWKNVFSSLVLKYSWKNLANLHAEVYQDSINQ